MTTFVEQTINLLARTAALVTRTESNGDLQVFLPTRNEYIMNFFGVSNFDFQEYHEPTHTYQVYDILTNQIVKLNIMELSIALFGLPIDIAPPIIANPIFHETLTNKDLFDYHLPFLTTVKELRDASKLKCNISKQERAVVNTFLSFIMLSFKEHIYSLHTDNAVSVYCNKDVIDAAFNNLKNINAYEVVREIYQNKENFHIKNLAHYTEIINDRATLQNDWKNYLYQKRDALINEYEQEKNTVLEELVQSNSSTEIEKQFIQAQYTNIIENLNNINLDRAIEVLPTDGYLFYVPNDLFPAVQSLTHYGTVIITTYDRLLIEALKENGIVIDGDLMQEFFVYKINKENSETLVFDDFLSSKYIDQAKEIRSQQIREHAEKLAKDIRDESSDLDESDIQEILDLVLDFNTFDQQLNELTTVRDVLQYWPAVLLPSPDFVKYI
jgi:hypothetical protein